MQDILTYLLEKNARIETSSDGKTPLHIVSNNSVLENKMMEYDVMLFI